MLKHRNGRIIQQQYLFYVNHITAIINPTINCVVTPAEDILSTMKTTIGWAIQRKMRLKMRVLLL
jgi:hypothetical protein